jgi:hypothetical protein
MRVTAACRVHARGRKLVDSGAGTGKRRGDRGAQMVETEKTKEEGSEIMS